MSDATRQLLRKQIRELRRAVPADINQADSATVCQRIAASRVFRESRHISFFIAADGELSLQALLEQAHTAGKTCYLPVSATDGSWRLSFCRWAPGEPLRTTPLGVQEPADQREQIAPADLDLVLTPLVAFDEACYRMGMGKGYYDRTFDFKNPQNTINGGLYSPSSPKMLGIAHECQRVGRLKSEWWDVPLDAVITPVRIYGDQSLF